MSDPSHRAKLIDHLVTRSFGAGLSDDEVEKRNRGGTLFAAGLITGEALLGVVAYWMYSVGKRQPK